MEEKFHDGTEVFAQKPDGKWVKAIPLPSNYGDPIPEGVRSSPEELKKLSEAQSGWQPYCTYCGAVSKNIGVSVCNECVNKGRKRRNETLSEWFELYKKDNTIRLDDVEDAYDAKNGTGKYYNLGRED